jgi:hypothetical protein
MDLGTSEQTMAVPFIHRSRYGFGKLLNRVHTTLEMIASWVGGAGWVAVFSVGTLASVLNITLCCIVGDCRYCVDSEG